MFLCYLAEPTTSIVSIVFLFFCFNKVLLINASLPSCKGPLLCWQCFSLLFLYSFFPFKHNSLWYFILFYLRYWGLNSGPTPWATPSAPPFFCEGFFWDRVSWTICPGWLWNSILLDLCLLSSWDYRQESPVPGFFGILFCGKTYFIKKCLLPLAMLMTRLSKVLGSLKHSHCWDTTSVSLEWDGQILRSTVLSQKWPWNGP
jgi:hypothetical protein